MGPMNPNNPRNLYSPMFSDTRNRRGSMVFIALIGILLATAAVVTGGLYLLGSKAQGRFDGHLEEGRLAVEKDRGDLALAAFTKAEAEDDMSLRTYRKIAGMTGKTFTTGEELDELIVGAALIQAYDSFFNLKRAPDAVATAEKRAAKLTSPEGIEMKRAAATARDVNALVEKFEARAYADVMKGLLAAEKNAQASDQDFFITEIRLLIACGKAMKEQAIIDHAREMLFFLAYEAGIKNKRIDLLWTQLGR